MTGRRRKAGRLGPQVEGYRVWLARRGYTPGTVKNMLADLGQLGRWLSSEGLGAAQLEEDSMVAFLAARQATGHRKALGIRAMVPLLSYLREAGLAPLVTPSPTPVGALLGRYRSWLVHDRGLAATTVRRCENTARRIWPSRRWSAGGSYRGGLWAVTQFPRGCVTQFPTLVPCGSG